MGRHLAALRATGAPLQTYFIDLSPPAFQSQCYGYGAPLGMGLHLAALRAAGAPLQTYFIDLFPPAFQSQCYISKF